MIAYSAPTMSNYIFVIASGKMQSGKSEALITGHASSTSPGNIWKGYAWNEETPL